MHHGVQWPQPTLQWPQGKRICCTFRIAYEAFRKSGRFKKSPHIEVNVTSLKEYDFFTYAKADGKKQKFLEPVDYFLEYKDAALTLHFMLPLKVPAKPKELALEVFDPSYFIDFQFDAKDPIRLVGAPATCQVKFQRPNDGTATAQRLNEQNFASGDNSNYGAMFANKIMVECP